MNDILKKPHPHDHLRLTKEDEWMFERARRERLSKMTYDERAAFLENESAEALREALSEENWGKS